MKEKMLISRINALEVYDSRGNPTVQVDVVLEDGSVGRAIVPSGASTGAFEAIELRDGEKRVQGKGVKKAVGNVNGKIANKLEGLNGYDQEFIDRKLIELDGTNNKETLGANAILGVSMAVAKAAANSMKIELYRYIGGIVGNSLPIPFMNILNGGKHSDNNLNIQEFMIVPIKGKTFTENFEIGIEVYHSLKKLLKQKNYNISVGDEGGFAPNFQSEEEAITLIIEAIKQAGYNPGKDVSLALDIASTEMYEEAKKQGKEGYLFWKTGEFKQTNKMIEYLEELVNKYPIISIEDGLAEEDWDGWIILTQRLGSKVQLVGDDLFVTNINRLQKGINKKAGNSILVKLNQIGTLSETLETIEQAKKNGYQIMISHRSRRNRRYFYF